MNPDTTIERPARSALSTIAGSAASDDRDANATAWAGAQVPPLSMPNGGPAGTTCTPEITTSWARGLSKRSVSLSTP